MGRPSALACVRCGARYPLTAWAEDCVSCRQSGPANLTVCYGEEPPRLRRPAAGLTLWRWAEALPVDEIDAVSLGEGNTPLVEVPRLARALGVGRLWVKDESRNPTWSFKDRLATVVVSFARRAGARVIASSSTGNAGAAVAAYAARAGLPCVVVTAAGAAGPMLAQMRAYGAMVLAVRDKADRWKLLEAGVRRYGWFPTSPFFGPVVGSNPYGIEGYKTLAYEIAEALDWRAPDWCTLPVCYGDALFGLWKGFEDLHGLGWVARRPRLIAAEIYGSLGRALVDGGDVVPDMPPRTRHRRPLDHRDTKHVPGASGSPRLARGRRRRAGRRAPSLASPAGRRRLLRGALVGGAAGRRGAPAGAGRHCVRGDRRGRADGCRSEGPRAPGRAARRDTGDPGHPGRGAGGAAVGVRVRDVGGDGRRRQIDRRRRGFRDSLARALFSSSGESACC